MDIARFCTKRDCLFFRDSDREMPIKWYRAPPGALHFPVPHKWGHLDWYSRPWEATGVGEVYLAKQTWFNGVTPPGVTGKHFHGPIEMFQEGCTLDENHLTPRTVDGVACECTGTPPPPPPVKVDVCGEGIMYLSSRLNFKCVVDPNPSGDCHAAGDVEFVIEYDPIDFRWKANFTATPGPTCSIVQMSVEFSPVIGFGYIRVFDWLIASATEPDCNTIPDGSITFNSLCADGSITRNPFKAQTAEGIYILLNSSGCGYRYEVTDPADG